VTVDKALPPVVVLTSPERSGIKLTEEETIIRARIVPIAGNVVTAVQLLVDGKPHDAPGGRQRFARPLEEATAVDWKVRLAPGTHRLRVLAETAVSTGLSQEVEVIQVGEKDEKGRMLVLAIGIGDYANDQVGRLAYPAADARALAERFQKNSERLYGPVRPRLLLDRDATRTAVIEALEGLAKEATSRDVVVVFFPGHGKLDSHKRLYLMAADSNPEKLSATGIAADELKRLVLDLPGRVLVLLDACHAGAIGPLDRSPDGPTDDLVRDLMSEENGRAVLCAAVGREKSFEKDGHGLFTRALLEALGGEGGKDSNGVVYLHHVERYVVDRVKELSKGEQHPTAGRPSTLRSFPLARP
jgi:hypothetical protein